MSSSSSSSSSPTTTTTTPPPPHPLLPPISSTTQPPPPTMSTTTPLPPPIFTTTPTPRPPMSTTTIPITTITPKPPPTSPPLPSFPNNNHSPPITTASSPLRSFTYNRSPLRETLPPNPSLPSPAPPPSKPQPLAALALAKLEDVPPVRAVETADRGSKVVSGIVRRSRLHDDLRVVSLAARVAAAVLSLISFSVMAADRTKGWAGDSFDRYREYRYCITVNIITFVYSSFQIYAHVHQIMTSKLVIQPPVNYYFDLFFDQMLAYLLISASVAASTRNYDWIVSWGSDPFTIMINASVSMSYLAFAALALCSLISAHNLFSGAA